MAMNRYEHLVHTRRRSEGELSVERICESWLEAQRELFGNNDDGRYGTDTVYVLSKQLDEKVARLHLEALGVRLTELTPSQADYLGVEVQGPYKPEHYRY